MIERIIIENFKSIRKLDLELKPINILVGANGAGKSNFISFFELASNTVGTKFSDANYDIDKLLHFGRKKSSQINGEITFDKIATLKFTVSPRPNSNYANSKFGFVSNNQIVINTELKNPWDEKFFEATSSDSKHLNVYHFEDTSDTSPLKKLSRLSDNRHLRRNGENLPSFLYYLQERHPKEFESIESQISSVAPFFDSFDLYPDRLNETQIELRWLEKGSDAYFNAYDLSDGTLRFIALATLLLQPDLPKTIIIDEPELGLHPFAINKLAAMMKQAAAKGSQVIVSTQSTDLISNFEPEDIITVDREDDQSVFRRLDSDELKDWLEDYTLGELWNKNVIGARP